jgi:predicted RNA-binding Zn-ribbon protein involved in translation (DUF1610 family)
MSSKKWLGLQFKCSACGEVFQVGPDGFKVMKKRVMDHAEIHLEEGMAFEIMPTNPERAIGMRWLCASCGKIIRLNKAGLADLRERLMKHARTHCNINLVRIIPIG